MDVEVDVEAGIGAAEDVGVAVVEDSYVRPRSNLIPSKSSRS